MFSRTHAARGNETYRFSATYTLSDFPLLIGEILRRSERRSEHALDLLSRSYIVGRFSRDHSTSVDRISMEGWSAKQKSIFFSTLPFQPGTWQGAEKTLDMEVGSIGILRNRGSPACRIKSNMHSKGCSNTGGRPPLYSVLRA